MEKRSIVLAVLILLVVGIPILYIVVSGRNQASFEPTIAKTEEYYRNFDSGKLAPLENAPVEEWYYYALLKNELNLLNGTSISTEELAALSAGGEIAFLNECDEEPFECSAFKTLAPYCILKKQGGIASGKSDEQILSEMPTAFTSSLDYWFNYFQEREIKEENLKEAYGYLVAEKNCGKAERTKTIDFLSRTLQVDQTNSKPVEKIRISSTKFKIIKRLLYSLEITDELQLEEILKNSVCLFPKPEELNEKLSLCDAYNYYESRYLCQKSPPKLSYSDYELAMRLLKKRPSETDEIACQLGLIRILKTMHSENQ